MAADLNPASAVHETKLTVSEEVQSDSARKVDLGHGVRVRKTERCYPVTIHDTLVSEEFDVRQVTINRTLEEGETPPAPATKMRSSSFPFSKKYLL